MFFFDFMKVFLTWQLQQIYFTDSSLLKPHRTENPNDIRHNIGGHLRDIILKYHMMNDVMWKSEIIPFQIHPTPNSWLCPTMWNYPFSMLQQPTVEPLNNVEATFISFPSPFR